MRKLRRQAGDCLLDVMAATRATAAKLVLRATRVSSHARRASNAEQFLRPMVVICATHLIMWPMLTCRAALATLAIVLVVARQHLGDMCEVTSALVTFVVASGTTSLPLAHALAVMALIWPSLGAKRRHQEGEAEKGGRGKRRPELTTCVEMLQARRTDEEVRAYLRTTNMSSVRRSQIFAESRRIVEKEMAVDGGHPTGAASDEQDPAAPAVPEQDVDASGHPLQQICIGLNRRDNESADDFLKRAAPDLKAQLVEHHIAKDGHCLYSGVHQICGPSVFVFVARRPSD